MRGDICITGIGAATPLGTSYPAIAENMLNGKSGVRKVTAFPVENHPSQIAGTVPQIPCPDGVSDREFDALPETERLILSCTARALDDADWWAQRHALRVGLVIGTASEWHTAWELDSLAGGTLIAQPQQETESIVHRVHRRLQLTGPTLSLSAACASSNYAFALARRWLELGWVDICLAGGGDMAVTPIILAAFGNLRALSRRNEQPALASRPFDAERDGFVLAEGGVIFVLEKEETASKRSAPVYARIAGCGATSDAHHMVIPSSDPSSAAHAMRQALQEAHLNPAEVDYVNAHATSTPVGDVAECRVLESVFGSDLNKIPVSSTKSMTGHLLTGAAAFEALACIIALERQALPPTINLDHPDPECRILHIANEAQDRCVKVALSNSFGFGGSNTCLVLRAA